MRPFLIAAAALLLTAPAASASHWTNDADSTYVGDSTCDWAGADTCVVEYLCTGGTPPPQVVDLILYCVSRAVGESDEMADWVALFVWDWAVDFPLVLVESVPGMVHAAGQDDVDNVHAILCNQVWSQFCSLSLNLPEHIPVDDPAGAEPPLP